MFKFVVAIAIIIPVIFAASCYIAIVYDPCEQCFEEIEIGMKVTDAEAIMKQRRFVRYGKDGPNLMYLHEDDGRPIVLELDASGSEVIDKLLGKRESAVERVLGFLDL